MNNFFKEISKLYLKNKKKQKKTKKQKKPQKNLKH